MKVDGWILDAGVCEDYIELWIKLRDGKTIPALFKYYPSFYAKPKQFITSMKEAEEILRKHDYVHGTERCKKFSYVYDHEKSQLFRVYVSSPRHFKQVIADVEKLDQFFLFNTDIPMAQAFFYDHDLFPMGFCEFELVNYSHSTSSKYLAQNKRKRPIIRKITLKDSNEEIFYKLPPLRVVHIRLGEFGTRRKDKRKFKDRYKHPKLNESLISCKIDLIDGYNLRAEESIRPPWSFKRSVLPNGKKKITLTVEEETEAETIIAISKEIESLDPDIILTDYGDEFFFRS